MLSTVLDWVWKESDKMEMENNLNEQKWQNGEHLLGLDVFY